MNQIDRIKYGNETDEYRNGTALYLARESEQCHDCGVEQGEYHRKGCDVEKCPVCKRQLLSCEHGVSSE